MAAAIHLASALTSLLCAVLLFRAYGRNGARLLLWSGLCFIGLFLNNALLFVDVSVLPQTDLSVVRTVPALAGIALLIFGLVWESEA